MDSDERFRRARSFHLMFIGAVALYVLIAAQMRFAGQEPALAVGAGLLWVARVALALLAVGLIASMRVVARMSASRPNHRQASPAQRALALALVRSAFGEAIGVYGLLLFLIGGQFMDMLVFATASLAVLAWCFPRPANWARDVARFESTPPA